MEWILKVFGEKCGLEEKKEKEKKEDEGKEEVKEAVK